MNQIEMLPIDIQTEIERSKKILELHDNFDDEGAKGYIQSTWDRTISLIEFLFLNPKNVFLDEFKICPGPNGSIDLHWDQVNYELVINIPEDHNEQIQFYGDNKLQDDKVKFKIKGTIDFRR